MKLQPSRAWMRQRRLLIIILLAIVAIATTMVYAYDRYVDSVISLDQTTAALSAVQTDAQLKQIKLQYIAAAQTAQAAKVITPATANTLVCHNDLTTHNDPARIDIVVNKAHCLSPINYAPADLVSVDGYLLSDKAAPSLQAMLAAASNAGAPLSLTSAYRSFDDQVATYSDEAAGDSSQPADNVKARPGYSEHQTGLAVDLKAGDCVLECLTTTAQYAWLTEHAADYGFIQRYQPGYEKITGYSAEAWHYRYVGTAVAKDMKAKGIHTLEQYWHISGGDYPS